MEQSIGLGHFSNTSLIFHQPFLLRPFKEKENPQSMNGKSALYITSRLVIQVWLFGMFLYLFGEPAIGRYLDKKVMVVTSKRETGGTEAPALTIIAREPGTSIGWKKNMSGTNFIDSFCGGLSRSQSITGCIEENTYNISEISQSVNIGLPGSSGYSNPIKESWIEDFTYSPMGRSHTLNMTKKLRYKSLTDNILRITLDKRLEYYVFIHDLKFFYTTSNPESEAPSVRKTVEKDTIPIYYPFALTEVEEMDVPHDPCNDNPDYNFRACVKESFAKKIGCKTRWDYFENNNLQPCTTIQQFRFKTRVP